MAKAIEDMTESELDEELRAHGIDPVALVGRAFNQVCAKLKESSDRISELETQLREARKALEKYAVRMEYDYPSDAPVECGLWCELCNEHIDNEKGHKTTCILYHPITAPQPGEKEKTP